jgi:hypothetical protein
VPPVIVKERKETVDLLHQADDKLKMVLEMYVPSRKSTDSNYSKYSKTSSRRSKTSGASSSKPNQGEPTIRVD